MRGLRSFLTSGAAAALASAVVTLSACTEDPAATPAAKTSTCDELASVCHRAAAAGGVAEECHDLGHDGIEEKCAPRRDACLAACAAPASAPGDAGSGATPQPAADAAPASPACASLCACLASTCTTYAGYPFAASGACEASCAALGEAERTCYPKWCAKAKVTPSKHLCEHAWGELGTAECESL